MPSSRRSAPCPAKRREHVRLFGRVVGEIEDIIAALAIPVTFVRSVTWRRAFTVLAGKDGSRLRASELLPAYAERFRRKRDDGRAEAALMALWGLTRRACARRGQGQRNDHRRDRKSNV